MGLFHFRLHDIGEGIADAEIVGWRVTPGDTVEEDAPLVELMTDKATVEMTSPVAGKVIAVHGEVGARVPVGSVLVDLNVDGDDERAASPAVAAACPPPVPQLSRAATSRPAGMKAAVASTAVEPVTRSSSDRPTAAVDAGQGSAATAPAKSRSGQGWQAATAPLAAPATRRRAHELGIYLQYVFGTGPAGRITPEDLDAHIAAGGAVRAGNPQDVARSGQTETRIVGLRRRIAERMQESKRRIPHITYVEECDVTELEALRRDLNEHRAEHQPRLTLLPFLLRALARVLPKFPQVNARYDDDEGVLTEHAAIHVGIATQTPGGLMVPVLRNAEAHDVWSLADQITRLSSAARAGTATREELSGSTITVTSLGALGGLVSTPVINHPEVAILAPNRIVERPTIHQSYVTVRKVMNLSSAFDHRIVDGYDAASFVHGLKRLVEHPALIFMETE